jgi:hypothetical protein
LIGKKYVASTAKICCNGSKNVVELNIEYFWKGLEVGKQSKCGDDILPHKTYDCTHLKGKLTQDTNGRRNLSSQ